ncbi:MAG: hypothetical protein U9O49_02625 [Candidatus Thermoplasmatota archaeon]|nr:hypothetical protein [Candidatus Thermoplasmatota archaeon]
MDGDEESSLFVARAFGLLKGKNIRFNPRPFSDNTRQNEEVFAIMQNDEQTFASHHVDVIKKVDALIEENEEFFEERLGNFVTIERPDVVFKEATTKL